MSAGDELVLGVRPQDLVLADTDSILSGHVQIVERLGSETVLNLATKSGDTIILTAAGDVEVRVGEAISLGFDPAKAHLFRPDGPAVTNREKIARPEGGLSGRGFAAPLSPIRRTRRCPDIDGPWRLPRRG